jgi:methyl-accepting chemotaxis protein
MRNSSITTRVVVIGVLCIVVLGAVTVFFSVRTLRAEIGRLNEQDYSERLRSIEFEYEEVDAVTMATAQVQQAQDRLLARLRDQYVTAREGVTGDGASQRAFPFIVNGDGEMIFHAEGTAVDRAFFSTEKASPLFQQQSGTMTVSYNGSSKWFIYSYFEPWDWTTGYVLENSERFAIVRSFLISVSAVAAAAAVLIGLGFALYLRRALGPLRALPESMERITGGDLTRRLAVRGNDEVSRISAAFNDFTERLSEIIGSLRSTAAQNQEVEAEMSSRAQTSLENARAVREQTSAMKQSMLDLNSSVEQSSERMTKITTNVRTLDQSIDEQYNAVSQSSSAVEQMTASLENVAEITRRKTESSERLRETVRLGGERLEHTREVIGEVTNRIDDISNLVEIIQGIASQTNLLSMNAAIEAAHAGQAGKGFAVVADEIRKLAEDSSQNSASISQIINGIIEKIRNASAASESTAEAFESIDTEVSEVSDSFQEIASSAGELSEGSEEIRNSMARLQENASKVKSDSQESNRAAEEIVSSMQSVIELSASVLSGISDIEERTQASEEGAQRISEQAAQLRAGVEELHSQLRGFSLTSDGEASGAEARTRASAQASSDEASGARGTRAPAGRSRTQGDLPELSSAE